MTKLVAVGNVLAPGQGSDETRSIVAPGEEFEAAEDQVERLVSEGIAAKPTSKAAKGAKKGE